MSLSIDDILDYAYSNIIEIVQFKVKPAPFMEQKSGLIKDSASEILLAVDRLIDHTGGTSEYAQRTKEFKHRIEGVYHEASAELFSGAEDIKHETKILKCREV